MNIPFSKLALLLSCVAIPAASGLADDSAPTVSSQPAWIALFDGQSLDGWTPKVKGYPAGENPGNLFRVEDGTIRVCHEAFDTFGERFGHLFYKSPFSRYKLRMEYRFFGEQKEGGPGWAYKNSGVMLHGQSVESTQLDQSFPDSIEVQFLGSDAGHQRPTGNICTPGTVIDIDGAPYKGHCINSSSQPMDGDQWTQIEVHADGASEILILVNGQPVLRATNLRRDDGTPLASGTISVQAESHDCAFRNIQILPLE